MKRMFKLIFLICIFVIKQEIYSSTMPVVPVGTIVATSLKNNKINDKFKELYKDKNDFVELNNILTIDEKELLNENYSLENYEKAREFFKKEIPIERENIKNRNIKKAKDIEEFQKAGFFRKIELILFEDVLGGVGIILVIISLIGLALFLGMFIAIINWILGRE